MYRYINKILFYSLISILTLCNTTSSNAEELKEILEAIQKDLRTLERAVYSDSFSTSSQNSSQESSLKLVIIQMPILSKMSDELSKLALASSLQGKFNEVHNYLYSLKRKSSMEDILADLFIMNIDITQLKNLTLQPKKRMQCADALVRDMNVKKFQLKK